MCSGLDDGQNPDCSHALQNGVSGQGDLRHLLKIAWRLRARSKPNGSKEFVSGYLEREGHGSRIH